MLPVNVAHHLIVALADNDTAVLDAILPGNAYLQVRGNGRMQIYWTRLRVRAALLAEFSRWHNPTVIVGEITLHASAVSITFQIEVSENGRSVKHDYFALLVPRDGQVHTMILYCYHDLPSATTDNWTLSFPSDQVVQSHAPAPRIGTFAY